MLTCEYCVKLKACSAKAMANGDEKNPKYEGERFCPDFKKVLTNADHIRAMSDEELAAHFAGMAADARGGIVYSDDEDRWLDWLKQPYKEKEE